MSGIEKVTGSAGGMDLLMQSVSPGASAQNTESFGQYMEKSMAEKETKKVISGQDDKSVSMDSENVVSSNDQTVHMSEKASTDGTEISGEEAVEKVNGAIKDAVKEILGIDEETFEAAMAELGFVPVDLLQAANLQKFVLFLNGGEEPTDLLMNETMMADFDALTEVLQGLDLEELTGMSLEKFSDVLESYMKQPEETAGEMLSGYPEEQKTEQEQQDIPVEEMAGSEETTAGEVSGTDDIPVTVVKESVQEEPGEPEETVKSQISESSEDGMNFEHSEQEDSMFSGSENGRADTVRQPAAEIAAGGTVFQQNLAGRADATVNSAPPMQQMAEIVKQVVEQIRLTLQADSTTMELQLNPESLGKVLLTVSSKEGMMTANFTVQTEEARIALESQMYSLREALEQKELKVDAVEVTVSDFEFTQTGQNDGEDQKNMDQGNGKSLQFKFKQAEDEVQDEVSVEEEAERVRRSVMRDTGGSIDFTA